MPNQIWQDKKKESIIKIDYWLLFFWLKHVIIWIMCHNCILRSLADSDAFQSGRCAAHNGRPETLAIIN